MGYRTEIRRTGTIMVVDDNPDILDLVCAQLRRNNFIPVPCKRGSEALNKLGDSKIDAVLTDIRMPGGLSGIELLVQVHSLHPEIPVILMTAFADLDTAVDAIKKGAFDFLMWPYKEEQLIFAVEKAVKFKVLSDMEKVYKRLLEEFNAEVVTLIAERTMSFMALTLADKIRNPATVIAGLCRQMAKRRELPGDVADNICEINREVRRLEQIVADFQTLLKDRESLFTYEDLNEVVGSALSLVEQEHHDKEVLIEADLSEQPLRINMQRGLLTILISHLLRNAIEATPSSGKITVMTRCENGNVVLTVSDTGSGIPEDMIEKIFDPFFSTKSRRFGMGLPLVKQIVTEHLGKIAVESRVGHGTVFTINLPLRWTEKDAAGT